MKTLPVAAFLLLLLPCQALAQDESSARFFPYTFVAPGGVSNGGTTLHVGGGFDALIWKGLGASVEGGYLGPVPDGFDYGIGVISANAVFHTRPPRRHQLTPFVTGGYSFAFREQHGNAINFGGGVNYWLSERTAMRVEFRDHMPVAGGEVQDAHLWGARFGFTWAR